MLNFAEAPGGLVGAFIETCFLLNFAYNIRKPVVAALENIYNTSFYTTTTFLFKRLNKTFKLKLHNTRTSLSHLSDKVISHLTNTFSNIRHLTSSKDDNTQHTTKAEDIKPDTSTSKAVQKPQSKLCSECVSNVAVQNESVQLGTQSEGVSHVVPPPQSKGKYVPPHLRQQNLVEVFPTFSKYEPDEGDEGVDVERLLGRCCKQGIRSRMEDCDIFRRNVILFEEKEVNFKVTADILGIFDDHGGKCCAEFLHEHFESALVENRPTTAKQENWEKEFLKDLEDSIKKTFYILDAEYLQKAKFDSSCANIVLVLRLPSQTTLLCVNLGDSESFILSGSNFRRFNTVHNPLASGERTRIENAGGWVTLEEESSARSLGKVEIVRVCGDLGVSRAFGDKDFKAPFHNEYKFWNYPKDKKVLVASGQPCFSEELNLVSIEPEFFYYPVPANEKVIFMLGCDGLSEGLAEVEMEKIVFDNKDNLQELAELLVNTSLKNGSSDNISCLVYKL